MYKKRARNKCGNTHVNLEAIRQYLADGSYSEESSKYEKRSVRKRAESFRFLNGELYYVARPKRVDGEPVEPNRANNRRNLRQAVLTQRAQLAITSSVHTQIGGNHLGTEKTLSALTSQYYWVGMAKTVQKVIKSCLICLASRAAGTTPSVVALDSKNSLKIYNAEGPRLTNQEVISTITSQVPESGHRSDEGAGDIQYVVKSELSKPEEVDADLDFVRMMDNEDSLFQDKRSFDVANKFWQKVEFVMLGPHPGQKKTSAHVLIFMDSYSKWPEIYYTYKVNEKTVSQLCLRLMARYGIMEQLVLLERDLASENPKGSDSVATSTLVLDATSIENNLQAYSVMVSKEGFDTADDHWNVLVLHVTKFVQTYKADWVDCLDLCLTPWRNSLSHTTDFTPSFLFMGREPVYPECIIPSRDSVEAEVVLNPEQMWQAVKVGMEHYLQCCLPDMKQVLDLADGGQESVPVTDFGPRRSGRKNARGLISEENPTGAGTQTNKSCQQAKGAVVTESPLVSLTTESPEPDPPPAATHSDSLDCLQPESDTGHELLDKVDLDTFYSIILLYKSQQAFPPHSDSQFQSSVQTMSQSYELDNGRLKYKLEGRLLNIPVTLEERLAIMKDAHIPKGGHHTTRLKLLTDIQAQGWVWRDMSLDIQVFVAACPSCGHRKRGRPSNRVLHWFRGLDEEQDWYEETTGNIGKVSNQELIDFLRNGTVPTGLTRSELLTFRRGVKNYKLLNGVLFFSHTESSFWYRKKKVLSQAEEQQGALKEAHGEKHANATTMKNFLSKRVFWRGIAKDIEQFIASCSKCAFETLIPTSVVKNSLLHTKLKLFQDFFAGKEMKFKPMSLDSLFAKTESTTLSPPKDLLAVAMESARLTSADLSSDSSTQLEAAQVAETLDAGPEITETHSVSPVIRVAELDLLDNGSTDDHSQAKCESIQGEKPIGKDWGYVKAESDQEDGGDTSQTYSSTHNLKQSAHLQPKKFSSQSKVRRRCETCREVIKGENNFKEHMYKHTKVKPFSCATCAKKFTSVKGLRLHSRKHTGHRPYLCSTCGRRFSRSASLRYHTRTHSKGVGCVPVVCEVCNRVFSTQSRMQKHKRFKHPSQVPVHQCQLCGKTFTVKRSLKRHHEAHQGIRKFECFYCQRSFFRKEYLRHHLVSHSNEDPSLANFKNKHKKIIMKKDSNPVGLSMECTDSQDQVGSTQQAVFEDGPSPTQQEVFEDGPNPTHQEVFEGGSNPTQRVVFEDGPNPTHQEVFEGGTNSIQQVVFQGAPNPTQRVVFEAEPCSTQHEMFEAGPNSTQQEPYSQFVEVSAPIRNWQEVPIRKPDSYQFDTDHNRLKEAYVRHHPGSDTVVVMGRQHEAQHQDVRHIILTSDGHTPQQYQNSLRPVQPSRGELTLRPSVHTILLPSGQLHNGRETVHYQLECLPGHTLTDEDLQAIRVLAEASFSGTNFLPH